MNKYVLPELLCAQYCSFYKPGRNEEFACKGFLVIEKLLAEKRVIPERREETPMSADTEGDLIRLICPACPFFDEDCDFAEAGKGGKSNSLPETVKPCGGFLCLAQCIDQGAIDIEDINRVI